MTKKIWYILIITCLFCSCNRTSDSLRPQVPDSPDMVKVSIYNDKAKYNMEKIPFSRFADSVRFVSLQTTEECPIRNIRKIFFHKQEIIVVDNQRNEIYFFDQNGQYLRKISNKGRGPGEYLNITVCLFNEKKETFIIYDINLKKLIEIDLNGTSVKDIQRFSEGTVIRDMIQLPDGNFLCYTYDMIIEDIGEKYAGLWETDSLGNFVKNHFNYPIKLPVTFNFDCSNFFKYPDGTIYLKDQIHNDIYRHNNQKAERTVYYDNKENTLPGQSGVQLAEQKNIKTWNYQAKGNYIFSMWLKGSGIPFFGVSSLSDPGEIKYTERIGFDDPAIPAVFTSPIDNNTDNIIIMELSPFVFLKYMHDPAVNSGTRSVLHKFAKDLNEDEIFQMNPILELLYIK